MVLLLFIGTCEALMIHNGVQSVPFSPDVLKTEAARLGIPDQNQTDYVVMQILRLKEAEIEKKLALMEVKKDAEKKFDLMEVKKDVGNLLQITKTGLLWRLKAQTQRSVLERFLSDCWECMKKWDTVTVTEVRKRLKTFPNNPADSRVCNPNRIL